MMSPSPQDVNCPPSNTSPRSGTGSQREDSMQTKRTIDVGGSPPAKQFLSAPPLLSKAASTPTTKKDVDTAAVSLPHSKKLKRQRDAGDDEADEDDAIGVSEDGKSVSPEDLARMSRSERKRHREKKRRSDVNKGFDELMSLLLEIDPEVRNEAEERARRGQWKGNMGAQEDNLLSRVDLISRTVDVLRRINSENEQRKQMISKLLATNQQQPNGHSSNQEQAAIASIIQRQRSEEEHVARMRHEQQHQSFLLERQQFQQQQHQHRQSGGEDHRAAFFLGRGSNITPSVMSPAESSRGSLPSRNPPSNSNPNFPPSFSGGQPDLLARRSPDAMMGASVPRPLPNNDQSPSSDRSLLIQQLLHRQRCQSSQHHHGTDRDDANSTLLDSLLLKRLNIEEERQRHHFMKGGATQLQQQQQYPNSGGERIVDRCGRVGMSGGSPTSLSQLMGSVQDPRRLPVGVGNSFNPTGGGDGSIASRDQLVRRRASSTGVSSTGAPSQVDPVFHQHRRASLDSNCSNNNNNFSNTNNIANAAAAGASLMAEDSMVKQRLLLLRKEKELLELKSRLTTTEEYQHAANSPQDVTRRSIGSFLGGSMGSHQHSPHNNNMNNTNANNI